MSTRAELTQRITDAGLVAIIRLNASSGLVETCRALAEGGITVAEITMTTPGALQAIETASRELGDQVLVGVGSVLDAETARRAVDAGAQFVISPIFKREVVEAAHQCGKPVIPGSLTPTEILTAHEAGADMVKVFPANHFGPRYFKDILAPMPHLKLTPTGGVDLDTIGAWFDAGAVSLGVGSALVKKELVAAKNWSALTDLARRFTDAVAAARGRA